MMVIYWCILAFFIANSISNAVYASDLSMPKELVEIAAQHDCRQIGIYLDRPAQVRPLYVYSSAEPVSSAAFWCEKPQQDERPYRLVVTDGEPSLRGACPNSFDWWDQPRGLAISQESRPLRAFRTVEQPELAQHFTGNTVGALLTDSTDGLITYFYCHNGKWMFETLE
jgi:hypothetical protein